MPVSEGFSKTARLEAYAMHDWTRVEAGIFHAFHHRWISAISDVLNTSLLPADYYALPEQMAAGFGSDVLTLQDQRSVGEQTSQGALATDTRLQTPPRTRFMAESEGEYYRRKKSSVVVRHVSGDRVVAMVEIVSTGNKASQHAFAAFIDKACEMLEHRVHLLIVDPFPAGPRDPQGIHAAIWENVDGKSFELPAKRSLTAVAYECNGTIRAYIETFAVGDQIPDMPLFLEPNGCVQVPLEATYQIAYAVLPRRWKPVLELAPPGT
jgi:hypothetical protein